MSYTDFQANKVQQLLASAFQHQYKEIPESYKQNYYFEQFLFEAAEVYTLVKRYEKVCDEFNKADISFFMQKEEGGLVSVMNYFIKDRGILDKRNIQIITTEDGTVIFFKDFDLNRGGKRLSRKVNNAVRPKRRPSFTRLYNKGQMARFFLSMSIKFRFYIGWKRNITKVFRCSSRYW